MMNMKMDAEEQKEFAPSLMEPEAPEYPYGLTVHLEDESLKKLGITKLPEVGSKMKLIAQVEVCCTSQCENSDGPKMEMSLQITDMELGSAAEKQDPAEALYGK